MKIYIDGVTFKSKAYDNLMKNAPAIEQMASEGEELAGPLMLYSLVTHCESEIETQFFLSAFSRLPGLLPQVEFERYRFDFGILNTNIVIEIDGHDYHKTKAQRTRDAKRERYLESKGFRVVRFTGSEIYQDVEKCVSELEALAKSFDSAWADFAEDFLGSLKAN